MQGSRILYLHMIAGDTCQLARLAGIRRYAAARGWRVEALRREASRAAMIPAILKRHRPVGCIVEGAGRWDGLPPSLFGRTPVAYIDVLDETLCGDSPRVIIDCDAVADTAFRELSALKPSCYAAVGFVRPHEWSAHRIAAFRRRVEERGGRCLVLEAEKGESVESYIGRIREWVAALPRGCAIFAVQGPTAQNILDAARAAFRSVPRDLALFCTAGNEETNRPPPESVSRLLFDFERVGYIAARTLDEWMHGRRPPRSVERMGPLYVERRESTRGRGRREPHILKALEMIRAEACEGLTARALAARFPGTRRLFDLRFREAMGHSVLDEILHVRMENAFTLLAKTRTAIGAIPGLCGFECDSTLDKLFRSRCGMSMREWRKRNSWK
ncbi:MAG: substrate-binding domain-containing protein [Kiritimatiellae bacterium]|nr:substrate-binding domain-containing protein [Kiritimatiellia bacterium]